jgi:hypothetical protein
MTALDWEPIFAWVGRATLFATPIGLAVVWFGKAYIDKWLTRRFQGQLDNLKHVQAQEIERLRAKIAGMLDRVTKLHQHEFEVLPKSWDLLSLALGSVSRVTASFKEVADPGAMTPEELEAFLAKGPLEDHQKQAIRDAGRFDKPTLYQTFHDRIEFNNASKEAGDFHNYTIQHGIFIEPAIRAKLMEASQELQKALRSWKQILQMPDHKPWPVDEAQGHAKKALELSKEIDALISDRLWSAAKLDA